MAVIERTASGAPEGGLAGFLFEASWLGLRTFRRFYRVSAKPIST